MSAKWPAKMTWVCDVSVIAAALMDTKAERIDSNMWCPTCVIGWEAASRRRDWGLAECWKWEG